MTKLEQFKLVYECVEELHGSVFACIQKGIITQSDYNTIRNGFNNAKRGKPITLNQLDVLRKCLRITT